MKALELILDEKNEIVENAIAFLGPIPDEATKKIDYAIALSDWPEAHIKRLTAEVRSLQAQVKRYKDFQDLIENGIKQSMANEAMVEIQGESLKAQISETQGSLEIYDESLLPPELFKEEVVRSTDDKRIKAMLVLGHEIPGARLKQGFRLTKTIIKKD